MLRLTATVCLLAVTLAAQDKPKLDARSFVPANYRCEVLVDFAALDTHGIWTTIRKSPVGPLFAMAEKELGFELADLKLLRAFPEVPDGSERPAGQSSGGIAIFEGNDEVTLPPRDAGTGFAESELHGIPALVNKAEWAGSDPDVWLLPKPGLLVMGTTHLVVPVLDGTQKGGVPDGEFLSLLGPRPSLAHVLVALHPKMLTGFPVEEVAGLWTEQDQPSHLLLRLVAIPDADDKTAEAQVRLEMVVRSSTGKAAPAATEKLLRQGLEGLKKHKQLGALKALWNKVEVAVDGRDVRATLPLGRARDAAASLSQLLGPLMMYGTVRAEPAAPAAVQADPDGGDPTPPAPDKAKPATGGTEKGKGGN